MSFHLRQQLTLTLDAGAVTNEIEGQVAEKVDRLLKFTAGLFTAVANGNPRLGFMGVEGVEELSASANILTVHWKNYEGFVQYAPYAERAWRELNGPTASVRHRLDGEDEDVTWIAPHAGSFGAGTFGTGTYGGEG